MSSSDIKNRYPEEINSLGAGSFFMVHRLKIGALAIVAVLFVTSVVPGCSWFKSAPLDPDIARIVFAPNAGGKSEQLLHSNKARRFIDRIAWPVVGGKIRSGFGYRSGRFHSGIDIPADVGVPIRAACTGRIDFAGEDIGRYGSVVVLRCSELSTLYAHIDDLFVDTGDEVTQGDEIATVGKTGNATGPHLHFETRILTGKGFLSVNPQLFYPR